MKAASPDKILPDKGTCVVPISYETLQYRCIKISTYTLWGCDEISNSGHEI